MPDAKIISEKPINLLQLKEELEKIKKRDKEVNLRVNKTDEYLQHFASFKKAKELEEKLTKLNVPRLKEQHIHKIIDVLPTTVKDLKVVLQGYTLTVNNDNMKKIADTVNGFVETK
jgi:DNA-directed RNA polymerase subunit F|tara:strand:- start:373 stop:720 length:348 start_codon:yes stop_codon:yes gene_type:complete